MSEQWGDVALGEVADVNPERITAGTAPATFRYAALSDVKADSPVRLEELPRTTFAEAPSRARSLVCEGDVIVASVGAHNAGFARVPSLSEPLVVSTGFHVLRARPDIHPLFLWAVARERRFVAHLVRHTKGTLLSSVSAKDTAAFRFALPPRIVQERIVDVLASADRVVAAASLECASMAIVRASATREGAADGPTRALGELAEVSQGKSLPKNAQGEQSGPIPWFKIADMAQPHNVFGYVRAETMMSKQRILSLGGRIVPAGSVVFPRVGAAVLTEKKRILDVDAALDENHLVLTPREGVSQEVLLAVIERLSLTDLSQAGAVPSLNMGIIRAAQVQWVQPEREVGLHEVHSALRQAARCADAHLTSTRALRANLLTTLLLREYEIPDSYDELVANTGEA